MSTNPIDPSDEPSAGFPSGEIESLVTALSCTEFRVQQTEPVVRDLNRHLTELIGPCPAGPAGNWVTLNDDGTTSFHLEVGDVLRLSTAFEKIASTVALDDVRRSLPSRQSLHHHLVETVERVRNQGWGESVHLNVRRPFGFFGKGR